MIRTMGVALRSLDRGPIAHPRPDRIYPSFADFQSVSGSKISNIYSRELFAFTEISHGAKRGFRDHNHAGFRVLDPVFWDLCTRSLGDKMTQEANAGGR